MYDILSKYKIIDSVWVLKLEKLRILQPDQGITKTPFYQTANNVYFGNSPEAWEVMNGVENLTM